MSYYFIMSTMEQAVEAYDDAVKKGRRAYWSMIARGQSGYITSLERLYPSMEITFEEDIGLERVPLKKIVGTWSNSRSTMFTSNFLPLTRSDKSEFSIKWRALYQAHLEMGIREPVKLYEYLNWYYVVEGNKRVSVLNYVEAYSVEAMVVRLLPRRTPVSREKEIYFAFLDFKNQSGISEIWSKDPENYPKLFDYIKKIPLPKGIRENERFYFFLKKIFKPFRHMYLSLGGGSKIRMTTGDAFLKFISLYGVSGKTFDFKKKKISSFIDELIKEESVAEAFKDPATDIDPADSSLGMTGFYKLSIQRKTLEAVFLFASTPKGSGWCYSHEKGRLYAQGVLGDRLKTRSVYSVPLYEEGAFSVLESEVQKGQM